MGRRLDLPDVARIAIRCRPLIRVAIASVVLRFVGPVIDARLHYVPRLYAQRDLVPVSIGMVVVPPILRICAHAAAIVEEQP